MAIDLTNIENEYNRIQEAKSNIASTMNTTFGTSLTSDDPIDEMSTTLDTTIGGGALESLKPIRGIDYWTEEDKDEIIGEVIEYFGGQPVYGIVNENNDIIMRGKLTSGAYYIRYEMEDGTYSDVGTLVVEATKPSYTNLADPTSADWQEGYRLSISSGSTSALDGHTVTNYIPAKTGDVLRVKGLIIHNSSDSNGVSSDPKFVLYKTDKTKLGGSYGTSGINSSQSYGTQVSVNGDISTYTVAFLNDGQNLSTSACAYIRFDGFLMDGYTSEDVIITVNEEITE